MRYLLLRSGWLWAAVLGLTLATASAQPPQRDASDPPVPAVAEPVDIGILMRSKGPGFQPLEFHQALQSSDMDLFFAGQKTYLIIPGSRSSVRFAAQEEVQFFLKIFMDSSDPRAAFFPVKDPTRFALYTVELERNERRIVLRDDGFSSVRRDAGRPLIPRLFGQSSFVLVPNEKLAPGEYAIKYTDQRDDERYRIFCFGVDER